MNDTGFYEKEKGELGQGIPSITREEPHELRIRLENCERRYEDLRLKNNDLHNRIVDLTAELEQKRDDIRRLQGEIDTARTDIVRLQGERDTWKQRFEECREIAEGMRNEKTELKDRMRVLEEEKEKAEREKKTVEYQMEKLEKNNSDLENTLKSQLEKNEYQKLKLTQEIESLQGELQEKGRSLSECQTGLGKWEEEKRELERKISALEEKIIRCRNFFMDFKRLNDDASRILETFEERPKESGWSDETPASPETSSESRPSGLKEKLWEDEKDEEGLFPL
ncbi:MAG: hypothetical protein HXS44_12880 [Theionarchaea archaeon]|nr:hypothetical protein [Theionarchaea archaeon]